MTGVSGLHGPGTLPAVETGLSSAEARRRLESDGSNDLLVRRAESVLGILRRQLSDIVIVVLLVAAVLTAAVGDLPDMTVILGVVVLNTVLGTVQEVRSGHALAALAELTAPQAVVVRDGVEVGVPAREVVVGDLLVLTAGDIVAGDGVVTWERSLSVDEALLTGESVPVGKHVGDTCYAGTVVTRGRGRLQVTATANRTAIGGIAHSLADTAAVLTPVQRQLAVLGRRLAVVVSVAAVILAVVNLLAGRGVETSLVLAISLAVAAIPESLPAVVALSLALAARRMAERGVLARRLAAVEALGSVTVIATDKTGTLTAGSMAVVDTWTAPGVALPQLLAAAVLCNDAGHGPDGNVAAGDDPTEVALVRAAHTAGLAVGSLRAELPRVAETPFDADTRRMSTTHRRPDGSLLTVTKGSPEAVLAELTDTAGAAAIAAGFAARAWRVLAVAEDGRLLGLLALADPVRGNAAAMIAAFRTAGVRPVMITGDHPATARAIAESVGVPADSVFARVRPEGKTAIVADLRAAGEIVAMTGDGVNDAPALHAADVGIAMGRGTEVAKQAASLVLTGDDLSAMVPAIGEGRRVYDNLRRFLNYALSGGTAEILIMLLGPLLGLGVPLQAGQILWVNLLTHGLPGVAIGSEAAAADVLTRAPRPPSQALLDRATGLRVLLLGTVIAAVSLLAGGFSALGHRPAQTTVFMALTFAQLAVALALRPRGWGAPVNRLLLAAVALNIGLTLAAVAWRPLQELLRTGSVLPRDVLVAVVAALLAGGVAHWQRVAADGTFGTSAGTTGPGTVQVTEFDSPPGLPSPDSAERKDRTP